MRLHTHVFIKDPPNFVHTTDKTPCPNGLSIPSNTWTSCRIPLTCRDHHRAIMLTNITEPMWIDILPPVLEHIQLAPGLGIGPR